MQNDRSVAAKDWADEWLYSDKHADKTGKAFGGAFMTKEKSQTTLWRSVSEVTPPDGKHLFGCFHEGKFYQTMGKYTNDFGRLNIPVGFRKFGKPSHWMPLPEPPND